MLNEPETLEALLPPFVRKEVPEARAPRATLLLLVLHPGLLSLLKTDA